jgi:hypothetical protein
MNGTVDVVGLGDASMLTTYATTTLLIRHVKSSMLPDPF